MLDPIIREGTYDRAYRNPSPKRKSVDRRALPFESPGFFHTAQPFGDSHLGLPVQVLLHLPNVTHIYLLVSRPKLTIFHSQEVVFSEPPPTLYT
jgi:hypothetical protein